MKLQNLIFLTFLAFGIASCSNHATYIKPNKECIEITINGGSDSLAIHSDGTDFEITHAPQWASVSLKDSMLTYNIAQNSTNKVRRDSIVIKSGEKSINIPVIQYIICTHINVGQGDLTFGKQGGKQVLTIESDGLVTVSLDNEEAGVTANISNGKLTVIAKPNTGNRKTCIISLNSDTQFKELVCTVAGDICPRCSGKGKITCPHCDGHGYIGLSYDTESESFDQTAKCPACTNDSLNHAGKGKIMCPECHGTGK